MEEQIRWYFIEAICQLDIDNITDLDFWRAVWDYEKYILKGKIEIDQDTLDRLWIKAQMCVANP